MTVTPKHLGTRTQNVDHTVRHVLITFSYYQERLNMLSRHARVRCIQWRIQHGAQGARAPPWAAKTAAKLLAN